MPAQGYGLLLSLDAAVVVVAQLWVTRRIRPYPPMLLMAAGTALYLVGFGMYGFVAGYPLFVVAILVITAGEMIVVPVGQALVAGLAPEDMRGRYIAAYELAWSIPATVGPWAAGLIMDNADPRWVWWAGAVVCAVAVAALRGAELRCPGAAGRRAAGGGFAGLAGRGQGRLGSGYRLAGA